VICSPGPEINGAEQKQSKLAEAPLIRSLLYLFTALSDIFSSAYAVFDMLCSMCPESHDVFA
jgi:hypothetical protein